MKKLIIILTATISFFVACNNDSVPNKSLVVTTESSKVKYQCPMQCQGDTAFTTEGKCPVCEMDLKKVE